MKSDSLQIITLKNWRVLFVFCIIGFIGQSCTDKKQHFSNSNIQLDRKRIKASIVPSEVVQEPVQANLLPPKISYLGPPERIYKIGGRKVKTKSQSISFSLSNELLLDKTHRQYPITKDLIGKSVPVGSATKVEAQVELSETGVQELIIQSIRSEAASFTAQLRQDQDGAIWGTTRCCGVWRFDGTEFSSFTDKQGLPDYSAVELISDSDGDIWFGLSTALVKYDGRTFTNYSSASQVSMLTPTKIAEDNHGNIWVGSQEGLYRIDKKENSITHFNENNGLLKEEINAIYFDNENNLWVVYNGLGFSKIKIDKYEEDYTYSLSSFTTEQTTLFGSTQYVHQDSNGNVLLGTNRGLIKIDKQVYSGDTGVQAQLISSLELGYFFVYSMDTDKEGRLYLGTTHGLFYIDDDNNSNIDFFHSLPEEKIPYSQVTAVMIDDNNYLWAGMSYKTPVVVNLNNRFRGIGWEYGIFGSIREVVGDESNVWFSTLDGGLYCIKNAGDDTNEYLLDLTKQVQLTYLGDSYLELDKYGHLWVGQKNFLTKIELQGIEQKTVVYQYDLQESHNLAAISDLHIDSKGTLWVTENTMSAFDKDLKSRGGGVFNIIGDKIYKYGKEQGLIANDVYSMTQDAQGNFWFNCLYYGLVKYEPKSNDGDGRWIHFDDEIIQKSKFLIAPHAYDGVLVNSVFGLILLTSNIDSSGQEAFIYPTAVKEDNANLPSNFASFEDDLWLGQSEGLLKITSNSFQPNPSFTIESYSTQDGLPIGLTSRNMAMVNDLLFIGADQQVISVAKNEGPDRTASEVKITDVLLFDEKIDWLKGEKIVLKNQYMLTSPRFHQLGPWHNIPEGLSLSYKDNYIGLSYKTAEIDEPQRVEYRHFLEGYESNWNRGTKETSVNYMNLPYGNYNFKVQARLDAGPWNEYSNYSFSIRPPWWFSWWAYVFYLLLSAFLIRWVYSYFLRQNLADAEAKRLIELDQLKTRLYTNITHEFRTPLTVISGMASQMKEDPSQWFETGLDMIQRNSNRLLGLVNQMLDLSKLESGKITMQYEQSDVITYFKYIVESLHSYAESENIHIHFHSDDDEIVMDFDRAKVLQIMTNLISNAIKSIPVKGSILVLLRIENSIKGQVQLQIKVRDTGVGIPKDDLDNIFNRFYQVDDSNTRPGEGSGIGLALVKELILLMSGEISVKSKLGEGTEFKILLPITNNATKTEIRRSTVQTDLFHHVGENEESSDTIVEVVTKPDVPMSDPLSTKAEILIVEDNSDVVAYIVSCLQDDYNILVGINGQEGVEIAVERVPDLVITDLMMPIMDGFELCQKLKSDLHTSHIPIIVLTAKSDMDSKLDGLSLGADAYLAKPFHKEELLVRIKALLATRVKLQEYYLSKSLGETVPLSMEEVNEPETIENEFVLNIRDVLEANFDDNKFSVENFQREMGMSKSQLFRKMNSLIGMSPNKYIRHVRLIKAKAMLKETDDTVFAISLSVGYEDAGYFSRVFKKEFGMTPSDWRVENS